MFDFEGWTWDGPFSRADQLESKSGIYLVWCAQDGKTRILDVGESGDVRKRVSTHDREPCWRRNCNGNVLLAALYTPGMDEDARRRIEHNLREKTNPTCGEQ